MSFRPSEAHGEIPLGTIRCVLSRGSLGYLLSQIRLSATARDDIYQSTLSSQLFTEHASAVILAVEVILARKLNAALVALFLLEIAVEPRNAVLHSHLRSDFIEELRVFERTDGQSRREVVKAELLRLFGGFLKPELKTLSAPESALRLTLQTLDRRKKFLRVIAALGDLYRVFKFL